MIELNQREQIKPMEYDADGFTVLVRSFIGVGGQLGDGGPQAFLVTQPPETLVRSHFHPTNQYQVFFGAGGSTFTRTVIPPVYVHYADSGTPYGPFKAGSEEHLEFFTLRARATKDRFYLPESRDKLTGKPGRLIHKPVDVEAPVNESTSTCLIPPAADGLAAFHLSAPAGQEVATPVDTKSDGQFVIIVRGSANSKLGGMPVHTCAYMSADEPELTLTAGSDGLHALVLRLPSIDSKPH